MYSIDAVLPNTKDHLSMTKQGMIAGSRFSSVEPQALNVYDCHSIPIEQFAYICSIIGHLVMDSLLRSKDFKFLAKLSF